MSKLRLITPNDADAATLSASPSVVATLPVTSLQNLSRAAVMRTTSTAAQDIKGTWSSSKFIGACALDRHNLTAAATWRVRLYSDAAWVTLVYDSGAVDALPAKTLGELDFGIDDLGASVFSGWSHAFSEMFFTQTVARSFIVTLADAANPAGYMQARRLYLGRTFQPAYNFEYGIKLGWRDDSTQTRTEGGTKRTDGVEPYRAMTFRLADLTHNDRSLFQTWVQRDGKRNDFWISGYPEAGGTMQRDHAMAAKLVDPIPEPSHLTPNYFGADFNLEEA